MIIRAICRITLVLFTTIVATFAMAACGNNRADRTMQVTATQSDVVAGYGERTFTERYHLSIRLPMPEVEFLSLLKSLGLTYSVCGKGGSEVGPPPPRHKTSIDLSKAETCYQIFGGIDQARHIGRYYRAFVDRNHHVIYIENAFSYTGP